jgi:hypothetical protein
MMAIRTIPLQHAPWLGRRFAAEALWQASLTTATNLAASNLGLKSIPVRRPIDKKTTK